MVYVSRLVSTKVQSADPFAKWSKRMFALEAVKLLGHVIDEHGILPNPDIEHDKSEIRRVSCQPAAACTRQLHQQQLKGHQKDAGPGSFLKRGGSRQGQQQHPKFELRTFPATPSVLHEAAVLPHANPDLPIPPSKATVRPMPAPMPVVESECSLSSSMRACSRITFKIRAGAENHTLRSGSCRNAG